MATKWKSKVFLILAVAFCLGGWYLTYVSYSRINTTEDYTDYFGSHISDSVYLKANINKLEATKKEEVTIEQIDRYRLRFGDFGTQIEDIRIQYEQELAGMEDSEKKQNLEKERDKKIKAIIENFTNDDAVKEKIIKEEQEYLKENQKELLKDIEPYLSDAENLYQYYFKDEKTGTIYTNVSGISKYTSEKEIEEKLKEQGTGKVYRDTRSVSLYPFIKEEATSIGLFENSVTTIKTVYMLTKDSILDKRIKALAESQQLFKKLIYVGVFAMLIGIILLYFYVRSPIMIRMVQKMTLDVAILLFLGFGFVAAVTVLAIHPYNQGTLYTLREIGLPSLVGIAALGISFVSLKVIWQLTVPKDREKTSEEVLKATLIYQGYSKGLSLFQRLPLWIKLLIFVIGVALNLFLLWFFFDAYGGVRKIMVGSALIILLAAEIKVISGPLEKINTLLTKPKEMLKEYKQDVSEEISLDEVGKELTQLNELIEVSQKDTMQSEMLKAELLTNVSHDLRTPLTSIITYGELLAQAKTSEENQKEYVDVINKKAQRMKHLIDDLFEVTKMNNGEIVLEKSEVNLVPLLQQSVSEFSEEFKDHELKFIFNKPTEDILLQLDGERMWRVFDNMLGNAVKYSMPNTRVYLRVERKGNVARIELKNISRHELNEDADQLVEKFKRGDSSRHTEGSGLGLAIVNSIVSLHEGSIDIHVDGDMFKLIIYLPI